MSVDGQLCAQAKAKASHLLRLKQRLSLKILLLVLLDLQMVHL